MPLVQYCRKCKAEVPLGEKCTYCGAKLTQTSEQFSFGLVRTPVKEWFCWNGMLRIALPVWTMIWLIVLCAEGTLIGENGIIALLNGNFTQMMLLILGGILLGIWLLLFLQGQEKVHVVLDRQGVHVRIYIPDHQKLSLYAHLVDTATVQRLGHTDERPSLDGLLLIKRITVPWEAVRRVHIWPEGCAFLFFRPTFWQCCVIRCPTREFEPVKAYVGKKLKRFKKVRILPCERQKNR